MHRLYYYIKRYTPIWLSGLLCCCLLSAHAQYFDLDGDNKRVTIPFKFVRNLIIIKLNINNRGPFNFILDTGAGVTLITDPKLVDSINIVSKRTIKIAGFGEGANYEAYITSPLNIGITGLVSYGVSTAILKTDPFGLSAYAGMAIHGLLGYELFNNLAVKIDFEDSTITVSQSKDMRIFRKASRIPISIEEHKPYVTTNVIDVNGVVKQSKLIIDMGAGHPISLENLTYKKETPKEFVSANLGMGLNGLISGYVSRIRQVDLGKYKIKDIISSFPVDDTRLLSIPRDGNLGMGLLKRFNIIFDYANNVMYLKQNINFRERFEYDMSGLGYYAGGEGYSHVIINKVDPGSAAEEIGLQKDDEIMAINFKPVASLGLQQIDDMFKSANGRTFLLEICRDKKYYKIVLTLKRRV